MIYILHLILALALCATAFAGAMNAKQVRKGPAPIAIVYYLFSFIGQIFALPLLLVTVVSLWFALMSQPFLIVIALLNALTILFCLIILRDAWLGSSMLKTVVPSGAHASTWDFFIGALLPFQLPKRSVIRLKNIAYGPAGYRNKLDIYMPKNRPLSAMPILIHVHGGAWTIGRKHQQAQPLIQYLASKGYLVVDINYRLAPQYKMPVMIQDVLRAVAWVKANAASYNGNPNFIAITGGSAGGHLVALAALASNHKAFKPGFEQADCSVNACIPVYGLYDFLNRNGKIKNGLEALHSFLTRRVMPGPVKTHEAFWDEVSPLHHAHENAPPMLILHGKHDLLADFESAKGFAETLAQISSKTVIFAEMPAAQHAYDISHAPPTPEHVRTIYRFLEKVRVEATLPKNNQ